MEENREAGVWQRVMGQGKQAPLRDLEEMLREAAALASVYRWAAGKLTGRGKALAQKLLEGEQANAACLRGIGQLCGRVQETVTVWEPGGKGARGLLQNCYHRTRRCQAEYTARSLEPEFGEVYRRMAERAGEHCALLAELLGRMKQELPERY